MMTPGSTISGKSMVVQTQYSQMKFSAVSFELLGCGFPPPTNKCMFCNTSRAPRMEEATFPQQKQCLNVSMTSKAANIHQTQ